MKTFHSIALAILIATLGLGLTSCKNDNEEQAKPADKTELAAVIEQATNLLDGATQGDEPGMYPAAAMNAFVNALNNVKSVSANQKATQNEVDQIAELLSEAIITFKAAKIPIPEIDRSALKTALKDANDLLASAVVGYKTGEYKQSNKTIFETAITEAQVVMDNKDALQADIDTAVATLNDAKEAFKKTANKIDYDKDLSLYLKLDGNTNDDSYYGMTVTLVAADGQVPALGADRFGVSNKAYDFAGGYIEIANCAELRPSEVTMSFWVKTASDASSDRAVISLNWWDGMIVKQIGKQMFFQAHNGGGAYIGTWTEFAAGTWYHVAVTCSSTKYEIYVNGTLDNSTTFAESALALKDVEPLLLGVLSKSSGYYSFQGSLDEFRFYQKVLSAEEISAIYTAERP